MIKPLGHRSFDAYKFLTWSLSSQRGSRSHQTHSPLNRSLFNKCSVTHHEKPNSYYNRSPFLTMGDPVIKTLPCSIVGPRCMPLNHFAIGRLYKNHRSCQQHYVNSPSCESSAQIPLGSYVTNSCFFLSLLIFKQIIQ